MPIDQSSTKMLKFLRDAERTGSLSRRAIMGLQNRLIWWMNRNGYSTPEIADLFDLPEDEIASRIALEQAGHELYERNFMVSLRKLMERTVALD